MTYEEACNRLPEYVAGELATEERVELDRLIAADPELQRLLQVSLSLETVLTDQAWLTPHPDFTARVLARIEVAPVPAAETGSSWWERVRTWLPAAAIVPLLVLYGLPVWHWVLNGMQVVGNRLDSLTGYTAFGVHPIVVLGLVAPLLAGGLATCVLTGRCRLSS